MFMWNLYIVMNHGPPNRRSKNEGYLLYETKSRPMAPREQLEK